MVIGNRLKELRESKELSQGDIEKRTGLLRCHISRVEHGHRVPAVAMLEKMARALEVPMYQLFHDGEAPASVRKLKLPKDSEEWGSKVTKPVIFPNCASYLPEWDLTTQTSCCTWPKKLRGVADFSRNLNGYRSFEVNLSYSGSRSFLKWRVTGTETQVLYETAHVLCQGQRLSRLQRSLTDIVSTSSAHAATKPELTSRKART